MLRLTLLRLAVREIFRMAKILVVDDSAVQAKAISKMLERHGHNTIVAHDGNACINLAAQELPDLIVLDIVMPELNGFQATRQITRNPSTEHIPILLVSGKNQETDKQWGFRQGAKGYIVKPLQEKELIKTVQDLLPS